MLTATKKMIVMLTAPALKMICDFLFPTFSYFSFLFSALGSESQRFLPLGDWQVCKTPEIFLVFQFSEFQTNRN